MILLPIRLDQPQCRFPWVTVGLVATQIVVFFLTYSSDGFAPVQLKWGFMPGYESLSTLITHMFLHDGYVHLLGNLIMFILPAMKVEDALGSLRFLGFFFACGIAALAAHVAMAGTLPVALVGSSGAVSGVIGAFMFLYPKSRMSFLIFPLPIVIRLKTWFFLGFWILKEVLMGYFFKISELDNPVAIWAHVGGFFFGAAVVWSIFGWDSGVGGETRLGAMRFLRSMRGKIFRRRRLGFWAGNLLLAIPAVYAIAVFAEGGLVNPHRLQSRREQRDALTREIASRQSSLILFNKAVEAGSGLTAVTRMKRDEFRASFDNEFFRIRDFHAELAAGSVSAPAGMIGDRQRFFAEEFPHFPKKCQIGVDGVTSLSVLYKSGLKYSIFCGTNQGSSEVFKAYLEELDERNWAVKAPVFDSERQTGKMTSSDGEWALEIVVSPSNDGNYKTHVLWQLEKMGE